RVRRRFHTPGALAFGTADLPVGTDPELIAGDRDARGPVVLHVVAVVVAATTQVQGVTDLGHRADGVADHHVDLPVGRVCFRSELGTAPDVGAVADRDHEYRPVHIGHDVTVDLDVHVHARRLDSRQHRTDRIAELAQVDLAEADVVKTVLPARCAAAGL